MSGKRRKVGPVNVIQRWRMTITLVAGLIVSIGGAATYWQAWGWPIPATRDWTDWRVSPLQLAQSKIEQYIQSAQLSQMESQLANLIGELTKWQAELPRTGNTTTRTLIQNRIEVLQQQIPPLTAEINRARGAK